MEQTTSIPGTRTTPSPCGSYIATFLATPTPTLRIHATASPETYHTTLPLRLKDIISLRWNFESSRIALITATAIEILNLHDSEHRVRLDNGSGGFGRFVSADWIGNENLLVLWEFGKARVWDVAQGGSPVEIGEVKDWAVRARTQTLAVLSRVGADDVLGLYGFAGGPGRQLGSVKLPTVDARTVEWSPDGRWISVLDSARASPSVHFLTPDGHLFRSYPQIVEAAGVGLGVKGITWSPNSRFVVLTTYTAQMVLLNTRTFTPVAILEHPTTITSPSTTVHHEAVSAAGVHTYAQPTPPFSPPISRTTTDATLAETGVLSATFSSSPSTHLVSRDARMRTTLFVWDLTSLPAVTLQAVIVQHKDIKRVTWNPAERSDLLMEGGERIGYAFSVTEESPPEVITVADNLVWLGGGDGEADSSILATMKSTFKVLYPGGRPESEPPALTAPGAQADVAGDLGEEDEEDDSLFDILSGKKEMPPRTDGVVEPDEYDEYGDDDDATVGVDDTFREKRKMLDKEKVVEVEVEVDPFDDSEIF